jgi:hypothetical protein
LIIPDVRAHYLPRDRGTIVLGSGHDRPAIVPLALGIDPRAAIAALLAQ